MDLTCPIRSVDLPGVQDVELHGLIVVVGPNSSGKTQFLHDLNETVCGRCRPLVVVSAVSFTPPPSFDEYFSSLVDRDVIREGNPGYFGRRTFEYGTDEGVGDPFHKGQIQNSYHQFMGAAQEKATGCIAENLYLKQLGALSCSALFLKNRLTLMDECQSFNHSKQAPFKTLQSLYWSKEAKAALHHEISQVFKRAIWVDNSRSNQLLVRVSESTQLPPADDRLEPEVMEKYRTIETEGDGLRSYCAICTVLLLEQRPLCLVDEPEMCLHPPQAHAMGRFIGLHAPDKTCTIVATHSSHVLRGILETNPRAQVIRLTRTGSTFQARKLGAEVLEQATSKPRSRSEAILEGLLSHGVILCEAEGDRIVYESTYRTLQDRQLDIRFVPSEGTGGFADPLRLYGILKVPSAVVTDIDFLGKDGELKRVLTELGSSETQVQDLCARARQAITQIRRCVSGVDPVEIQDELKSLGQSPIDFTKNEDIKLRRALTDIVARLSRLHDFQQVGLEAVPEFCTEGTATVGLRGDVRTLVAELEQHGVFLVPVGKLESWLPKLMKGHSREDKSRWAMLAAERIEAVGERNEDVWQFIRRVHDFLQGQLANLVELPSQENAETATT